MIIFIFSKKIVFIILSLFDKTLGTNWVSVFFTLVMILGLTFNKVSRFSIIVWPSPSLIQNIQNQNEIQINFGNSPIK